MVTGVRDSVTLEGMRWLPEVSSSVRDSALLLLCAGEARSAAVVHDSRGKIVAANPLAQELLGLTWEQLVGLSSRNPRWQAVSEAGVPLSGDQHPDMLVMASGRSVVGTLMGVLIPGGVTRWLQVTAHPLLGTASSGGATPVSGALVLFSDASATWRGQRALEALLRAYRLMADNVSDIVLRVDANGDVQWISPSVETQTGWRPVELIGRSLLDIVHSADVLTAMRHRQELLDDAGEQRYELRIRLRDGTYRWMEARAQIDHCAAGGGPAIIVAFRDIDAQKQSTAQLAASERHYRMLVDNSTDVIAHVRGRRLVWVTPSVQTAIGASAGELRGQDVVRLLHPDDTGALVRARSELAAGQTTRFTARVCGPDGSAPWFDIVGRPFMDELGQADGIVLRLRDVSSEVLATQRLEHLARHDDLTGLVNRQELAERMDQLAPASARGVNSIAVAFCDVDHFKDVNDTYGHETGDALLREIAARITSCVRSGDIVARLGGDELVVVLNGVRDIEDAYTVMEKIRLAVAAPFSVADEIATTSLSIGLCLARLGEAFADTLRRADGAVYRAKRAGRNRVMMAELP